MILLNIEAFFRPCKTGKKWRKEGNERKINARHPCMRCPTRCDRGQKNLLALRRKLGIRINSEKEDNLVRYKPNVRKFSPENFHSIWLSSQNFRNFLLNDSIFRASAVRHSETFIGVQITFGCPLHKVQSSNKRPNTSEATEKADGRKCRQSLPTQLAKNSLSS